MKRYKCSVCGHIYNPEEGDKVNKVVPGTPYEELPYNWICPECDAPKEKYETAE